MVTFTKKGRNQSIKHVVNRLKVAFAVLLCLILVFTTYLFKNDPQFQPMIVNGKFLDCSTVKSRYNNGNPLNTTAYIPVRREWRKGAYNRILDIIQNVTETSRELTKCEQVRVDGWMGRTTPGVAGLRSKEYRNPCWNGKDDFMCVPKIFALSVEESGLIDFFYRLTSHPELVPTWGSEGSFRPTSITNQENFKLYGLNIRSKGYYEKNKLLVEQSIDFTWGEIPQDMKVSQTNLRLALVKKTTPDAKFIFILHDPVKAAADAICPPGHRIPPNACAYIVSRRLHEFSQMTRTVGLQEAFDHVRMSQTLFKFMYIFHLHPYLRIFPREQFYFISTTDYSNSTRREQIMKEVYQFLGVKTLAKDVLRRLAEMPEIENTMRRWADNRVFDEVAKRLAKLYAPFNEALFENIGTAFDWRENS